MVVSFVDDAILLAIVSLFRRHRALKPIPLDPDQYNHKEMTMNNDNRNLDASSDPRTGERDYVEKGSRFDDHGPAYGFGVDARGRYPGRDFDDVESEMSNDWAVSRGASILSWEWARHAARDAWNRVSPSHAVTGIPS